MIPTTPATSSTVRGVLISRSENQIVLGLPGTDYQLHLEIEETDDLDAQPNDWVTGIIHARARRVDTVHTGGRFIEPVYGRPRRLQGTIVGTDLDANTITVDCGPTSESVRTGCPFVCELVAGQKSAHLGVGALVGFDVERGATFGLP